MSRTITYPIDVSSVEPWLASTQIPFDDSAASSIKREENRSKTEENSGNMILYPWKIRQEVIVICRECPRKTYVQGPIHAKLAANKEPKSCPSVAPAPIKPNNLEPDWIKIEIRIWKQKGKMSEEFANIFRYECQTIPHCPWHQLPLPKWMIL